MATPAQAKSDGEDEWTTLKKMFEKMELQLKGMDSEYRSDLIATTNHNKQVSKMDAEVQHMDEMSHHLDNQVKFFHERFMKRRNNSSNLRKMYPMLLDKVQTLRRKREECSVEPDALERKFAALAKVQMGKYHEEEAIYASIPWAAEHKKLFDENQKLKELKDDTKKKLTQEKNESNEIENELLAMSRNEMPWVSVCLQFAEQMLRSMQMKMEMKADYAKILELKKDCTDEAAPKDLEVIKIHKNAQSQDVRVASAQTKPVQVDVNSNDRCALKAVENELGRFFGSRPPNAFSPGKSASPKSVTSKIMERQQLAASVAPVSKNDKKRAADEATFNEDLAKKTKTGEHFLPPSNQDMFHTPVNARKPPSAMPPPPTVSAVKVNAKVATPESPTSDADDSALVHDVSRPTQETSYGFQIPVTSTAKAGDNGNDFLRHIINFDNNADGESSNQAFASFFNPFGGDATVAGASDGSGPSSPKSGDDRAVNNSGGAVGGGFFNSFFGNLAAGEKSPVPDGGFTFSFGGNGNAGGRGQPGGQGGAFGMFGF